MDLVLEDLEHDPYLVSFEIHNEKCKGLKLLRDLGITEFVFDDLRITPGGNIRHLLRIDPNRTDADTHTLSYDCLGCQFCMSILASSTLLVSCRNIQGSDKFVYSFVAPNFTLFQDIISNLEHLGFDPIIRRCERYRSHKKSLTHHQQKVLWNAYALGFFDYPRKINSIELSKKLGIVPSTLSEVLRRGLRRLVEAFFE